MRHGLHLLFPGILAILGAFPARALPPLTIYPIYGDDDRRDVDQTQDARLRRIAESVPALVQAQNISCPVSGECSLESAPYESAYLGVPARGSRPRRYDDLPLRPGTRFYGQPSVASCSGALIAPDLVLTAGHCLKADDSCADIKFVFGFLERNGSVRTNIPRGEIYSCAAAVRRRQDLYFDLDRYVDFAIVRLDRPVRDHPPLEISGSDAPSEGTPVLLMGYPDGLPLKIAANAVVQGVGKTLFVANLDGFHGNSGGPVFNARTLKIVGIEVTEPQSEDYARSGRDHLIPRRHPDHPSRPSLLLGVTRVSVVLPYIRELLQDDSSL